MILYLNSQEAGIARSSFMTQLLEGLEDNNDHREEYEEDIAALGGIIFLGKSLV